MNGRNFEKYGLLIIKIIMFPIMLFLYIILALHDEVTFKSFKEDMADAMKQYWSIIWD